MKYLVYSFVMLTGYGLTYGLFPLVLPPWLAVDMALILVLTVAQSTKDYTASVIGLVSGIVIDIFVSPSFGLCTLIYAFSGYFYAKISSHLKTDGVITAMVAIFVFYLLKDGAYMLYGLAYGTRFMYVPMLWGMSLPSALVNAAVGFPVYLFVVKLHELRSMRAKRELDLLKSYREQTDWLAGWFEQYK